jgi:hypothetical protein
MNGLNFSEVGRWAALLIARVLPGVVTLVLMEYGYVLPALFLFGAWLTLNGWLEER